MSVAYNVQDKLTLPDNRRLRIFQWRQKETLASLRNLPVTKTRQCQFIKKKKKKTAMFWYFFFCLKILMYTDPKYTCMHTHNTPHWHSYPGTYTLLFPIWRTFTNQLIIYIKESKQISSILIFLFQILYQCNQNTWKGDVSNQIIFEEMCLLYTISVYK